MTGNGTVHQPAGGFTQYLYEPPGTCTPQELIWRRDAMWQDPIVAEVRRWRDEYAKRFNYDIEAICRDARRQQEKSSRDIVTLPPKPARTQESAQDKPGV